MNISAIIATAIATALTPKINCGCRKIHDWILYLFRCMITKLSRFSKLKRFRRRIHRHLIKSLFMTYGYEALFILARGVIYEDELEMACGVFKILENPTNSEMLKFLKPNKYKKFIKSRSIRIDFRRLREDLKKHIKAGDRLNIASEKIGSQVSEKIRSQMEIGRQQIKNLSLIGSHIRY